ncbi:MAG: hypothetical protein JO222_08655 [Frankiales bacterium]|nr:hypothetical protein [Frankiales bacterium]
MARVDVVREIAADPAGVALLLAGPAARELWPAPAAQFGPPSRSGLGFALTVTVGGNGSAAHGTVTVRAGETPGTCVVRFTVPDAAAAATVGEHARRFLDGLAERARSRSSAA